MSTEACPTACDTVETLYSVDEIAARCEALGQTIAVDYAHKQPLVLITLTGATLFASDLLRRISPVPKGLQIDFIRASSYIAKSVSSSETVTIQVGPETCACPSRRRRRAWCGQAPHQRACSHSRALGHLRTVHVTSTGCLVYITVPFQYCRMHTPCTPPQNSSSNQPELWPACMQDCSKIPVEGRNVLLIEDIVDTGHTLTKLLEALSERGALSVKTVTLLDKPARRQVDVKADYTGFVCEDKFVVGYVISCSTC